MKHFFKSSLLLAAFFCLVHPVFSGSATITASQDVYVRMDEPTTNYNNTNIAVRKVNDGTSGKNNKAILQFEYQYGPYLNDAALLLDLKIFNSSAAQTIRVWGVLDGYTLEDFDEAATTYNNWTGIFDSSGDGTNNNLNRLHDGNPSNTGGAAALGSFSVNGSDVGGTISFTSDALVDFVQSDTNGKLTILLTASSNNDEAVKFAANEDTTYSGPRLHLSADDETYEPSFDTYIRYNDNSTDYDDSTGILVKLSGNGSGTTTRVGIVKLAIAQNIVAKSSDLLLDLSQLSGGSSAEFYVWGLIDSGVDMVNLQNLTWSNWEGIVDGSIDGVDSTNTAIYGNEPLGTFSVDSSNIGQTVSFSSNSLNNLINDDTNGKITLLLTRVTNNNNLNSGFASSEHPTLQPPRLVVRPELERDTLTADSEIRMIDVDGDNEDDMVLVVNMPDGGGIVTADPFVIADYLIQTGYGLGLDTDFYDSLSSTQQISISDSFNVVINTDCATSFVTSPVTADDLYNAVDSMSTDHEYQVGSFTVSTTLEADIESGEIALEISMESCTLLEVSYGNFSATIDGPSAQAAFVVTEDRIAFGAEYSYYTATVGYTSNSGSEASISASAGGGFFVDISLGQNGVYGATFPIAGNVSISLYISADDAEAVFNDMELLLTDQEGYIEELLGEDALENLDMNNANLVSMVNNVQQSTIHVNKTANEITVFVRDAGEEVMVVFDNAYGAAAPIVSNALNSIANTTGNITDELLTFSNSAGNFVKSTWSTASGWIEGTVEDIGKGFVKWITGLW